MDPLRAKLSRGARRRVSLLVGAALGVLACGDVPGEEARATISSQTPGEGGSPVSIDSALTLFRGGLEPMAELEHAESSLDAIVERLANALERNDTATLRNIVMSRREFAWLYYPTSVHTREPMKQEPGLVWFLHLQQSEKGASRLMNRYGGKPLPLRNSCASPTMEGGNRLWFDCVQHVVQAGKRDTTIIRLFGGVYERNGRFKIFSYSNDL